MVGLAGLRCPYTRYHHTRTHAPHSHYAEHLRAHAFVLPRLQHGRAHSAAGLDSDQTQFWRLGRLGLAAGSDGADLDIRCIAGLDTPATKHALLRYTLFGRWDCAALFHCSHLTSRDCGARSLPLRHSTTPAHPHTRTPALRYGMPAWTTGRRADMLHTSSNVISYMGLTTTARAPYSDHGRGVAHLQRSRQFYFDAARALGAFHRALGYLSNGAGKCIAYHRTS